mgnify:CR=1 FL=1
MVPGVHERDPLRLLMIALAVAGSVASAAPAAGEEERSLTRAVYEFAVTGYCGLVDAAVDAGFRAEVAALTARAGLADEAARRQRLRGWVAAEEEWRNRGLGGQRAWCAEEGAAAARRFKAIAGGGLQP